MITPSLQSVLSEMTQQTSQIGGLTSPFSVKQAPDDSPAFADILLKSIGDVNNMQVQGKQMSEKFLTDDSDTSLNDVMISLQKSSVSLNLGVQVRNKLVNAYQDIMNMTV